MNASQYTDSRPPLADTVTRRLLFRVCGVICAGVLLGMTLGFTHDLLTPLEWVLLPALLPVAVGVALCARFGDEHVFLLAARTLGVGSAVYLLIGVGHHLPWRGDPLAGLVYLAWLPGYHVLIFTVVDAVWARRLSLVALLVGIAMLIAMLVRHPELSPADPAVSVTMVLMLVQLAVLGLLPVMMRFRTRFAAAEARTQTLQQVEDELRGALDEARVARTDAERQHRQARDAHARLATVFRELDIGLALFDSDGVLALCNDSVARLLAELGLDAGRRLTAAAIARAIRAAPGGDVRDDWQHTFAALLDGSRTQLQVWAPDGRSYLASGARLAGGEALFSLVDTSELERNRHALARLQRMESLARLVGGVAHDFNNLFGALMASLEMLDDPNLTPRRRREVVELGLEGVERGATLTSRLLRFAGRGGGERMTLSLADAVASLDAVVEETGTGQVTLSIRVPDELPPVHVDEAGLHGALAGLVRNACEAMPHGGTVFIDCGVVSLAGSAAESRELAPGDYVEVICRDTGVGIDPEVMDRVLEPFYSTKLDRHGVGLGLSSAYGFARESGGDLRIASAPGEGTTVRLLLPAARHAD